MRSGKLRPLLGPLWETRGYILQEKGRKLSAARSYWRCVKVEELYKEPSFWRRLDVLEASIDNFLAAGYLDYRRDNLERQ
jgi:hypothetical protein